MLSRVAERLYWAARYIERAENTARMIMSFQNLALDMPKTEALSWRGLVAATGMETIFDEHYQRDDERNCVKFLIADGYNPSSIFSSLRAARENVRTTRDQVPSEAWEVMNELYLYARDNLDSGISKRGRYGFLSEIVRRCQMLTGLLSGCMSHDAGYDFIRLGRNLERADMTTRQIEIGAIRLLEQTEGAQPYDGLLWTSVLRSQSAFQMYRQHVRRRVSGAEVVRYLLQDLPFPRSVAHSLNAVSEALSDLPHNDESLRMATQAQRHTLNADVDALIHDHSLHAFMDQLQEEIAAIHFAIADAWFPRLEIHPSSPASQTASQDN
jgi:uncharacterized alpha-E superfamily protein